MCEIFWKIVSQMRSQDESVDTIYSDFKKAFDDTVLSKRLLRKVSNHMVKDKVLPWIKKWLKDKIKRLEINR